MPTVADILKLCEQKSAGCSSFGHHAVVYGEIADMIRSATDFEDPDKAGVYAVDRSYECDDCHGRGETTGPRGGRRKCDSCLGDGYIYVKKCPKCDHEVHSDSRAYGAVRCAECRARGCR